MMITLYHNTVGVIMNFLSLEERNVENFQQKPSMFLASDVIKRHFGVHTESQESASLRVAKHFLGLCLARRRL